MTRWKAETTYRLLEVDPFGDIDEIDRGSLAEMKGRLGKMVPNVGCILTIAGQRERRPESVFQFVVREFRRTGIIKTGSEVPDARPPQSVIERWSVRDAKWYESGDEPGFDMKA